MYALAQESEHKDSINQMLQDGLWWPVSMKGFWTHDLSIMKQNNIFDVLNSFTVHA